jgi:hypothetical protein
VHNEADDNQWDVWVHGAKSQSEPSTVVRCKLYVSPAREHLYEALTETARVIAKSSAVAVKVGRTAHGLLRPDKLVVYFENRSAMLKTARRLGAALSGAKAQGVPFTASAVPDGLLSWGVDPMNRPPTLGWGGQESWRIWITNRLADWLIGAAQSGYSAVRPWRFALERLSFEGIDPGTFAPTEQFAPHR